MSPISRALPVPPDLQLLLPAGGSLSDNPPPPTDANIPFALAHAMNDTAPRLDSYPLTFKRRKGDLERNLVPLSLVG
jgi:hypothetical protein